MSNIEWTDTTWNPVVGCTPISPGCLNCYAATMARRLEAMGKPGYATEWVTDINDGKPENVETVPMTIVRRINGREMFTGLVRTMPDRLTQPLRWRKPRMILVNSMSDLFHETVPFEFIDRVFAVMALCPQHRFQVLTKRPERMAEYLSPTRGLGNVLTRILTAAIDMPKPAGFRHPESPGWPYRNVWLGTSVEDQARADERIPHLLRCPAAVRFLSCEPMLGQINLDAVARPDHFHRQPMGWSDWWASQIHWVIVGGESGPHARPCNVEWIRSIVRQCRAAGVPCFTKQLGAQPVFDSIFSNLDPTTGEWYEQTVGDDFDTHFVRDPKGGDPAEWPEDLRVREWPEVKS